MLNILFKFKKCKHINLPANIQEGYCPDCGEYIKNNWYIIRCKHCKIKRKAQLIGENILPSSHFCPNCGGLLFEIEKLNKIDFININFAVLKKEIISTYTNPCPTTTWVETPSEYSLKLISQKIN